MKRTVDKLVSAVTGRGFLLFWLIFFIYMANPTVISSSDATPTRLLPISIIRERNFDLNEFAFLNEGKTGVYYTQKMADGRIVSQYPVFTAVLAVPVYLLPVVLGVSPQSEALLLASKLTATLITALSAVFIYWTIKRLSNKNVAWIVALVYALGTANWPISSQDLWQHGPAELFICITLYLFTRSLREERYITYAGFTLSWTVALRPPTLVIALILTAYVFMKHRNVFLPYALGALPMALAVTAYSTAYLGNPLLLGQLQDPTRGWTTPLFEGLTSLLISPNIGLLVRSPVLILAFVGMLYAWLKPAKGERATQMEYYTLATLAILLLWSKWWAWHGVVVHANRMLIETLPFLALFLIKPVEIMLKKPVLAVILAVLVIASIALNFAIIASWDRSWDQTHNVEYIVLHGTPEEQHNLWWNTSDLIWVHYAKKTLARLTGI